MKIGRRFLAILISMTVISSCFGLPVLAEETIPDESTMAVPAESLPDETLPKESTPAEVIPTESILPEIVTENAIPTYIEHEVRTISDLVAAFGASNVTATSATEIRVLRSFSMTSQGLEIVTLLEGTYRIDFNGFRVSSYSNLQALGANVTLCDSSAGQTGGWTTLVLRDTAGVSCASALYQSAGSLTILSGRYISPLGGVLSEGGAIRIDGGEFLAVTEPGFDSFQGAKLWQNTSVTITGGIFEGPACGLELGLMGSQNPVSLSGGAFRNSGNSANTGAIQVVDMMGGTPSLTGLLALGATALPANVTSQPGFMYTAKTVMVVMTTGTEGFVYRLYSRALGRNPDYAGYRDWVAQLKNKRITGAGAAYGFIFSVEMNARNLSDRDFVTILYNVFLQRSPDDAGMQNWLYCLSSGMSRQYVFSGFANSAEWKYLCTHYSIDAGSFLSAEARDQNVKVTAFVSRLYTNCLNRPADVSGLNYWAGALNKKTQDGAHVAYGFFFSQEMINRKLSNDAFVETLYTVILGRSADAGGKASWVAQLNAGKTRLEIFKGFVNSNEFSMLCAGYGIIRGTM